MKRMQFIRGEPPHIVEAEIIFCGEDLVISVGGGSKYHTGAVAIAYPTFSSNDPTHKVTTTSVIAVAGHREEEITRFAANTISKSLNRKVTVAVGLHIDNATENDINQLVTNFNLLIKDIQESIS